MSQAPPPNQLNQLLVLLDKACKRPMTPHEQYAQRVSFVASEAGVSKDRVEQVLSDNGWPKPP